MQEKQFLQKQKQGNHTESVETEILCRKTISAKNKTEKPNLFCRNSNIMQENKQFLQKQTITQKTTLCRKVIDMQTPIRSHSIA